MSPALQIQLLGEFRVLCDRTPVSDVVTARLQSLLGYLILHREAPQPRSHLAFLFWPDSTEKQARTNLRKQIYHLRQRLPEANRFLHADSNTVQWRPDAPAHVDVVLFERALARAEAARATGAQSDALDAFEEAVSAYRGMLLPSLYDDWVLTERERLHHRFLAASEDLISLLEDGRAYRDAIQHAQRLLRHDPLHEGTYQRLMRLYALEGDRVRALHTFHACAATLEAELGVEPSQATVQAYERLLKLETEPARPRDPRLSAPPLVGRDEEWRALLAAWQSAQRGRSQLVLLTGEPGIGKTRLADAFVSWARQQGIASASVHCYASEGNLAYGPVVAWLRSQALQDVIHDLDDIWLHELARLLPELATGQPSQPALDAQIESWQQRRFFEALARPFLARQSLVLHLDDIQWCDADTLAWLPFLLHPESLVTSRAKNQSQLLLIVTQASRDAPSGKSWATLLMDLHRKRQLTRIALHPLEEAATASLAEAVAGRPLSPELSSELYRETEGNPLFVVETVRAGIPSKVTAPQDSPPPGPGRRWETPPAVQEAISMRLEQLSDEATEVAGVASVIGRQFNYDVLARACSCEEDELVQAIDELWQQRIVHELGTEAYDFAHDKFREIALDKLSKPRRRLIHRRVAAALEDAAGPQLEQVSALIAAHLEQGGAPDEAIPYYRRAADASKRVYANSDAENYYLNLLGDKLRRHLAPEEESAVWLGLGEVQRRTGNWAEAEASCQKALEIAKEIGHIALRARSQWALADVLRLQGAYGQALALLERAGDDCFTIGDRESAVRVFWTMGEVYWYQGEYELALAALERQLLLARDLDDRRGICDAASSSGMVYWSQGQYQQAETRCRQAIELASEISHNWSLARALQTMGRISSSRFRILEAWKWHVRALRVAAESGDRQCAGWAADSIGLLYLGQGDAERALPCLKAGLANSLQTGDRWSAGLALAHLAKAYAGSDRDREAKENYCQAIALARSLKTNYLKETLLDYASFLAERGSHQEALALVDEVALSIKQGTTRHIRQGPAQLSAQLLSVRLRLRAGEMEPERAKAAIERLLGLAPDRRLEGAVLYELWRLEPGHEEYRDRASELCRDLYAETADVEMGFRFTELTGESLPKPTSLPDLSATDLLHSGDMEALLRQADQMIAGVVGEAECEDNGPR